VRFNADGRLRVPWGYVSGLQVDPIEKKPFYHAFPGRDALSFGMLGCDFHCGYCQNWVTSQSLRDPLAGGGLTRISPEELVDIATSRSAPVMVSTYNEPLITADWAVAVFKPARARGIVCGFVSNGNVTPEVLEFIRPYVDLYKIDLKGFDDRHYRELGGVLANVLDGIRRTHALGFWVEVVTLLVPGFNDSDDEIRRMADFIAGVSCDIPWHLTAFHPDYRMLDAGRTPTDTLLRAHAIGKSAWSAIRLPRQLAWRGGRIGKHLLPTVSGAADPPRRLPRSGKPHARGVLSAVPCDRPRQMGRHAGAAAPRPGHADQ
jgi:pyruvate formate lyase activating enzyme